jgi:hypothetical protein
MLKNIYEAIMILKNNKHLFLMLLSCMVYFTTCAMESKDAQTAKPSELTLIFPPQDYKEYKAKKHQEYIERFPELTELERYIEYLKEYDNEYDIMAMIVDDYDTLKKRGHENPWTLGYGGDYDALNKSPLYRKLNK